MNGHAPSNNTTAESQTRESAVSATAIASPPPPPATTSSRPCYIHYGQRSVKARIDPDVPLSEIIRQLAASTQLQISEPPALFALREKDTGELITDENLPSYLARGVNFRLGSSPVIEAAEMVDKLNSSEANVIKLGTFSLRTHIKERGFLGEFLARGGLDALQEVIRKSTGNTLAYALLSMQELLDLEQRGWEGLSSAFVSRLVEIIATEPLINICRPATAILRRLSLESPAPDARPTSPTTAVAPRSSGFAAVYDEIRQQPAFLKTVVQRLASGDVAISDLSLGLINSLFRGAIELGDPRFGDEMEELDAWRTVTKLLDTRKDGDLSLLYAFQGNLIMSLHQTLITSVEEEHFAFFDELWTASKLEDTDETNRWRRLGFRTESPQVEFAQTGVLGLKALVRYAEESQNEFASTLKEILDRPEDRRCPVATASNAVVFALAEFFDLTSGIPQTPTEPMPFLLRFYECHTLALQFFLRMWTSSGSTTADFERIATLTRGQIREVLQDPSRSWFDVRKEFLHSDYRTIRDKQMQQLVADDSLLTKPAVRQLRGRLYLESYEFVRNQRINCLHEGAWFAVPNPGGAGSKRSQQHKAWRFYRLAPNRQTLHYVEAAERKAMDAGLDDLPEKIDMKTIIDVTPTQAGPHPMPKGRSFSIAGFGSAAHGRGSVDSTNSAPASQTNGNASSTTASNSASPSLSFSLLSADGTVAELVAPDRSTYSEWLDGLSLLRPDGNICTKETADYVATLTDFGLRVRLLDLTGDKIEVPSEPLPVPPLPAHAGFHYNDQV